MQYLAIKQEEQNGKIVYVINAIPLKNKNKSVVQKIPHPLGSDFLEIWMKLKKPYQEQVFHTFCLMERKKFKIFQFKLKIKKMHIQI